MCREAYTASKVRDADMVIAERNGLIPSFGGARAGEKKCKGEGRVCVSTDDYEATSQTHLFPLLTY